MDIFWAIVAWIFGHGIIQGGQIFMWLADNKNMWFEDYVAYAFGAILVLAGILALTISYLGAYLSIMGFLGIDWARNQYLVILLCLIFLWRAANVPGKNKKDVAYGIG